MSGIIGPDITDLRRSIAHFNQIMGNPMPLDANLKRPFLQCEDCQWQGYDLSVSVCPKCKSTNLSEMRYADLNDNGYSGEFPLCSG